MKQFSLILVMFSMLTLSAQHKEHLKNLNPEQKMEIYLKKMTLKLDLTDKQISQIKPILANRIQNHKDPKKKENRAKMSDDQKHNYIINKLDRQIAFNKEMKNVLNEKQYDHFKKMQEHRNKKLMHKKNKRKKKHCKGKDGNKEQCSHKKGQKTKA